MPHPNQGYPTFLMLQSHQTAFFGITYFAAVSGEHLNASIIDPGFLQEKLNIQEVPRALIHGERSDLHAGKP